MKRRTNIYVIVNSEGRLLTDKPITLNEARDWLRTKGDFVYKIVEVNINKVFNVKA